MKNIFLIACILVSISLNTFGQRTSETAIALGISKTTSPDQEEHWNEGPAPTYLKFFVTKNWYNSVKPVSLREEADLNLQYANVNLGNGGLGGGNHYKGNIVSLFADAALLVQFRINQSIAIGIGPMAEILVAGKNDLNNSYYTMLNYPNPTSGNIQNKKLNRDYFNQPSLGIKLSLFESQVDARTSMGLNFSYMWTKIESSNFYATNYTRISFVIGFRKQKKEVIPDPQIEQAK